MRHAAQLTGLFLVLSTPAWGAGFYATEFGARAMGRAGADMVHPRDGYAVWHNPAALALHEGASITMDAVLVQLNLEYQRTGPYSLSEYSGDFGGYRVENHPHVELDPTDIGLNPGDDWTDVFRSGRYPSEGSVVNHGSPFVMACGDVLGGGFDGRGHCPIVDGIVVLGGRALGVPGLALSIGAYGPPTGSYWFWDESLATDPGAPEAERYLDDRGLDKRFVGPQRYVIIDRDVLEAFYQFTGAYQLSRYLAVGVGLQAVESGLRMRTAVSVDTYGTEDPAMDAVINIDAHAAYLPSGNIGVWSNPFAGLELGASYQLPRPVTVRGPVRVDYTGPGLENFEIEDSEAEATVRFNMPAIARLGALYRVDPWFDVELDFFYEQWSSWTNNTIAVKGLSFGVPGLDSVEMPPIAQPKGYQDAWSIRLGGDVDPLAALLPGLLTLRAGAMYESSAIPNNTLDVSLIDADKFGISAGLELAYMGLHLRAGYQHRFLADVEVTDTLASTIAPLGEIFGYETRTAAANGSYRASFDAVAMAFTVDAVEMYDFFAGDDAD